MVRRVVCAAAVAFALAACGRPSQEACDRLCWRYAELQFWEHFEAQARDLSPADRATLKAERDTEWAAMRAEPQNRGRDNCVSACRKGGSQRQIDCVEHAATAAAAAVCMKD
jgi:hypothetical protein